MKKNFLPIVKPETCFSVEKNCFSSDDFLSKHLSEIRKKNPIVGMWIDRFSKTTEDKEGSVACAVIVYKLLESQEEANYLNSIFEL